VARERAWMVCWKATLNENREKGPSSRQTEIQCLPGFTRLATGSSTNPTFVSVTKPLTLVESASHQSTIF
jgi:hypothetical protein